MGWRIKLRFYCHLEQRYKEDIEGIRKEPLTAKTIRISERKKTSFRHIRISKPCYQMYKIIVYQKKKKNARMFIENMFFITLTRINSLFAFWIQNNIIKPTLQIMFWHCLGSFSCSCKNSSAIIQRHDSIPNARHPEGVAAQYHQMEDERIEEILARAVSANTPLH